MTKRGAIWVLAAAGGLVLLFFLSVAIATAVLGKGRHFPAMSGVGVVEVKGLILDAKETVKQLNDFRKDDAVKAVVLRVDSPGGVVGPSQEIYAEVKKLAEKKKVVVSMGSVAASGGYYIAAPATRIYANPGTITGSIGVLMKLSNIEGLMGKVGLKAFTIKSGRYKDTGSPVRPMTPEDKAILQGVIDSIHGQFIRAVSTERNIPLEEVRRLADGRIFTGEQALPLKLVDRLGNLQDAIAEAGRLAGIKGEPAVIYPPRKKLNFWDILLGEAESRLGAVLRRESGVSANYELDGAGMWLGQE